MDWVEKTNFEKIQRLLEISEQERHHEILLTVRNLHDWNHNPLPYSIPVIPRPLPAEIIEGEHFVITDLQHLVPGSSPSAKNPKIRGANETRQLANYSSSSSTQNANESSYEVTRLEKLARNSKIFCI